MSEIRSYGLAKIEMGDVGVTGSMGTVLTVLGKTLDQTVDFVQDDPTITDINSTEDDTPEETFSVPGKTNLKFSIMDCTSTTLAKVMGGTVTGTAPNDAWNAPVSSPSIEQSVKITTKTGLTIEIARGKVTGKINYQFRKNAVLQIDVTIQVLVPTDGTTMPIVVTPVPA